jgi:hypothetical protein
MMHKRFSSLKSSFNAVNSENSTTLEELRSAELERLKLRDQIDELRKVEEKYHAFKEYEPEIKHYLNSFSTLAR